MAQILFLTQVLPYPLDAGPKIRAYYVLRHLAQQHQVHLVSFVRGEDRDEHVKHVASFCDAVDTIPMIRSRWRDARSSRLLGRSVSVLKGINVCYDPVGYSSSRVFLCFRNLGLGKSRLSNIHISNLDDLFGRTAE